VVPDAATVDQSQGAPRRLCPRFRSEEVTGSRAWERYPPPVG
jgi:hypothetical protein